MPRRKIPFITSYFYHVFNRGISRQKIFVSKKDYTRAIKTTNFYKHSNLPFKLSKFIRKTEAEQKLLLTEITSISNVKIVAYTLMPNHFHFLVKQTISNGISKFMSDFQNSYTKYFNARHKHQDSLLQRQLKSVLIESGEQLVHLARYIVLNPFSGGLVTEMEKTISYPYTYLNSALLQEFTGITKNQFIEFVKNQADYQKRLEVIKHLTHETELLH